jgi:hypothetical protein
MPYLWRKSSKMEDGHDGAFFSRDPNKGEREALETVPCDMPVWSLYCWRSLTAPIDSRARSQMWPRQRHSRLASSAV